MHTHLECLPCLLRMSVQASRIATRDEAAAERSVRAVAAALGHIDLRQPAPFLARTIHAIIRRETNNADPYAPLKRAATETALNLKPRAQKLLEHARDRFDAAVRLAIAGNVMDFAVLGGCDAAQVEASLDAALSKPLDSDAVQALRRATQNAKDILYLADNAGETVFDTLLLAELPPQSVTYVVKAAPVINDATRDDAAAAGIERLARIIDNGSDGPGTLLDLCSAEFKERFHRAEVVIAKGQANLETLLEPEREVYHLLQVKCRVVSGIVGLPMGEWAVLRR